MDRTWGRMVRKYGALSPYSTEKTRDPSGSLVNRSYRPYVLVMR